MPEIYDCDPYNPHSHDKCIEAKIKSDGIPRCYICGNTIEECDSTTDENGFNECEWLAEK